MVSRRHVLFFASALLPSIVSATCYWQNSTAAPNDQYSIARDDVACFPSQENSPCCGTGWSCLSDGVCYIKQGDNSFYYRGTCTDKTWASQQCPGWCFAENNTTSIPLIKCQKPSGEDWYCCPNDPECDCSGGKDAIKLGASQPVTVTVIGSTSWPGYQSTSTPIAAGNIASGGTASTQGTTSATANSGTTNSVAAASASATSSNASVPSASSSSSSSNTTALAAGLGAGIGVAVILVGAGAFFLFNRSKKRRTAATAVSGYAQPPHNSSYPPPTSSTVPSYNGTGSAFAPTGKTPTSPPIPRAGEGYYATQLINEKDGTSHFGTQELPVYHNVRAEMDGTANQGKINNGMGVQGRVELA